MILAKQAGDRCSRVAHEQALDPVLTTAGAATAAVFLPHDLHLAQQPLVPGQVKEAGVPPVREQHILPGVLIGAPAGPAAAVLIDHGHIDGPPRRDPTGHPAEPQVQPELKRSLFSHQATALPRSSSKSRSTHHRSARPRPHRRRTPGKRRLKPKINIKVRNTKLC